MLERYFKLKENNTTIKTEVVAGITTFVTMAYIIFVNPDLLSQGAALVGGNETAVYNGVFFATCLAAFLGTILMGLYAKLPFAQAPGMGLNAFFAFSIMAGLGYTYNQGLGIVLISGVLFLITTVFGLREAIVKSIPKNIRLAIAPGIGLFIAFVGFQNAGIIVKNDATLVSLTNFSLIGSVEGGKAALGALVALIGVLVIGVLWKKKVKGSILIGILVTTVLAYITGYSQLTSNLVNFQIASQFNDFVNTSLFKVDIVGLFPQGNILDAIFTVFMLVVSFFLVDLFDTIGTLMGTAQRAGMMDEDGNMPRMKQAFMCDAIATTAGAFLGTSTVTTFVESSAGVAEGGRTGLTSVVTAGLFLLSLCLAPFVGLVPGIATAPALIIVGVLMMGGVKDIDFEDMSEGIPAFFTVVTMALTYSIANGIALGVISYVIIKVCTGKVKEINVLMVIIAGLFLAKYFYIG